VQDGCGYKDTLRTHRYFALLAKYFTVCITYQPTLVFPVPQEPFLPMSTKMERLLNHLIQDRFDTKVWQSLNNQGL